MDAWGTAIARTKIYCALLIRIASVFLVALSLSTDGLIAQDDDRKALRIAQIDWCPEICPAETRQGYVVELIEAAFEDSDFRLEYTTYPWSRALVATRTGLDIAVIAPAKKEAPDLIYPQYPVGTQRACFYTRANSDWRYTGADSLKGLSLGLPTDMSLEELQDYVVENKEQFHFQSITDRYVVLSIRMLVTGRLDAFGFTENAVLYRLEKDGIKTKIRQAGCVSEAPVYLAFSPTSKHAADRAEAMALFDARMAEMIASGRAANIRARYNLP